MGGRLSGRPRASSAQTFPNKKRPTPFVSKSKANAGGTYRPDADKVTVKEVCESFLEHCTGRNARDERMTRKMLTVYRGHVNNHILSAEHGIGDRKLSQLTHDPPASFETGFAMPA